MLFRIMSQLSHVVEQSGFALVDPVDINDTVEQDVVHQSPIQMLSYRKTQPGLPTILLELCHLPDECWITATLWRPDDLLAKKQAGSIDEVALHYRGWSYDHRADLGLLADAITVAITCWLDRGETPPARIDY